MCCTTLEGLYKRPCRTRGTCPALVPLLMRLLMRGSTSCTQALRDQLPGLGLVSFVGDGSILPRWVPRLRHGNVRSQHSWRELTGCCKAGLGSLGQECPHVLFPPRRKSGASDEPMPAGQAVPFRAPDSLVVTVQLPNRGAVRGLGIRCGLCAWVTACQLAGVAECLADAWRMLGVRATRGSQRITALGIPMRSHLQAGCATAP